MSASWSLQDAKNKFSTVVEAARTEGPQIVTKRGQPAVVVVAAEEFDRLRAIADKPQTNFVEFLLSGPKVDIDLPPDRPEILARDLGLLE